MARLQRDKLNRMKAANKEGILRRMSWTGLAGAGAETALDDELQEVARRLARKYSGAPTASQRTPSFYL